MCGCHMPKQWLIAMTCDSKIILLWHVISVKSNIGKKITGLQTGIQMTLNHEKN